MSENGLTAADTQLHDTKNAGESDGPYQGTLPARSPEGFEPAGDRPGKVCIKTRLFGQPDRASIGDWLPPMDEYSAPPKRHQ